MENYNRSHRYRDDNRSSSNENNYDNNWDRTYNRSDDWGGYNNENRDVYSSDRERGYWSGGNGMNRNYYNDDFDRNSYYSGNNRNSNSDYNSNYRNNYNRDNFRGNSYHSGTDYNDRNWSYNDRYGNDYNDRNRNEGWHDNYRNDDRNWWDKTKDEVESWFGDEDAKRRRRMDEMNEGKHRGKGPKNYSRSQERIKEDVSDKLSDDSFLDASGIEVEVNGNEVTLSGTVDSRYSKHRAEDIAEDVTGVTHVQNNLRVNETTPQENRNTNSSANSNTRTGADFNKTNNRKDNVNV
jgi:osmotically-inducible protein OsmY